MKALQLNLRWLRACAVVLIPAAVCRATDTDGDGIDDAVDVCCNTPSGTPVDAQGRPIGDIDLDCDTDMIDLALFIDSMTGPLAPCEVDECAIGTHECDVHAQCHDLPDGYECVCDIGYKGDGFTCGDIDECAANPAICGADTVCINTEGGYHCGCLAGTSDCDASPGCEVNHDTDIGTCAAPTYLGSACGDAYANWACPETHWRFFTQRTGRQSAWFRVRIAECSSCCAYLTHHVTLLVPPGTNYDLEIVKICGIPIPEWESHAGPGMTEQVEPYVNDDCSGSDHSTDILIHVRHISGESCQNWTLQIENRD